MKIFKVFITATAVLATSANAFAQSEGGSVNVVTGLTPDIKTALFYLADPMGGRDPESLFEEQDGWRGWLNKSVFPGESERREVLSGARAKWLSAYATGAEFDGVSWPEAMSVSERERDEAMAREEAYRVMANMVLSIDAVARMREMLEPFTRPVEVYKGDDGSVTTSYFGQAGGSPEDNVRLFSVNVGLSASHNLNLMVDIYDSVRLSYTDGRRMEMNYSAADSQHGFGIAQEDMDKLFLIYRFRF